MMKNTENIKTVFDRSVQAMNKQPGIAKGIIKSTAVHSEGLACDVTCGPWKLRVDMPRRAGGTETGPSPGQMMNMALGSCQVVTTMLWAAKYDVPVEKLEIKVEAEKDSRGLYGVDNQPSHWRSIKYHVDIQSPAHESKVTKVLEAAYNHSPMRDNLEHPFKVSYDSTITTPVANKV